MGEYSRAEEIFEMQTRINANGDESISFRKEGLGMGEYKEDK